VFEHRPPAQAGAGPAPGQPFDLLVLLCRGGALGVDRYRFTLEASDRMVQDMIRAQPSLATALPGLGGPGVPVRVGERNGRAALFLAVGHGVVMTPLAVMPSRDASLTIVITMDDPHLGEPGHEPSMKKALEVLAAMLRLADEASPANP